MRMINSLALAAILLWSAAGAAAQTSPAAESAAVAVGPQYDTTHVYVAADDFDRFVASFVATFGGTTSKQGVFTVTPTPSSTMSQLVLTPAGTPVLDRDGLDERRQSVRRNLRVVNDGVRHACLPPAGTEYSGNWVGAAPCTIVEAYSTPMPYAP